MSDTGQAEPRAIAPPVSVGGAALWMGGAVVALTSMALAGRAVSLDHDTFEIMLYRSLVGLVVVLVLAARARTLHQINLQQPGLHLARNLCHFAGQNLWFLALASIPLAQVFALEFTTPIWVLLLSPLLLGEALTRRRALVAAVGFAGILIVARPGAGTIEPGLLAAALAAIGFAGSAILTKRLTRRQTITCILFYLTGMQAVLGLVCAGFDGDIALPTARALPWLVLIGGAGLAAHFCLTNALRLAPASVVMPMDFARLPAIAIIGAIFYAEPLNPWILLGAVLILGANYAGIAAETRAARRA